MEEMDVWKTICTALFALALSLPSLAATYPSSCWVVSDMQAIQLLQGKGYKLDTSSYSEAVTLVLDGKGSVSSVPGMTIEQIDEFMALSTYKDETTTTIEVYQIDPSAGKALYTKSLMVKGTLSVVSGVTMAMGLATKCQ